MLSDDTKRPNYRDGQYLGPADFVAEQRYHSDLRRRLALGQHTWGIFDGLELEERPREASPDRVDLFVTPGLAIDGFGRELIAYAPQKLDVGLFVNPILPAGWVAVWIRYAPEFTDPPRYGYEICDDPEFAYRTRETFRIDIGDRPIWHDPVTVAGLLVPDAQLPVDLSVAHQGLPDDAEDARWSVQLGYAHWDGVGGFIKSETPQDAAQRVKGRIYGGVVAAHTYPPGDAWELATRERPNGGVAPRVAGTVRGKLTVEDVVVALGTGVELHDSAVTFLDADGKDRDRPLTVTRVDGAGAADLKVTIGKGSSQENRFVIAASKPDRVVVYDDGSVDVAGNLHVEGVVDLVHEDGDRIVLWGEADDPLATAIGVEGGGSDLYSRAETVHRWYVGEKPDAGGSARMALSASDLAVRGDAIVGWNGNGALKVRHVNGKVPNGNSDDDLYLNWNTGHNVHVGGGTRASLEVHGDVTAGAGGDGFVRTRHVQGKHWQNDTIENLHLNWNTGRDVVVGSPGVPSDLFVNGGLFLGNTKIPVDVAVGRHIVNASGFPTGVGFVILPVQTRLPSVSQAQLVVALSHIQNDNFATDTGFRVAWTGIAVPGGGSTWNFTVQWNIENFDSHLFDFAWIAVFVP